MIFNAFGKQIRGIIALSLSILMLNFICFADETEIEEGAECIYPAGIFSDNMVFQQNEPIVIWGNSEDEGKYVYVKFDDEVAKSKVVDEKWEVTFPARAAVDEKFTVEIYGAEESNYTVLKNVMIGDVWLVLGQDNAEFSFGDMGNFTEYSAKITKEENLSSFYIDSSDYKRLAYAGNPFIEASKNWYSVSHPMIANTSAIGLCVGIDLAHYGENQVPVGVISMGFSGQGLSCFMPEELSEKYAGYGDGSVVYNTYIQHINRFPIKGVIWYQGESNSSSNEKYAEGLAEFITAFREVRNQVNKNFPFYIVEIPPCFDRAADYQGSDWQYSDVGRVRAVTGRLPMLVENCYIVSTSDTWDNKEYSDNIHPDNKTAISGRLALMICANEWGYVGYDTVFAPVVKSVTKMNDDGTAYELTYDCVADGLKWINDTALGFSAATTDMSRVEITAEITGKNTVLLTGDRPIYRISYGVRASDMFGVDTSLCNSGGVPAAAFTYDVPDNGNAVEVGADNIYPAGIFSDNMILQQDEPIIIWGESADEGKYVYADFDGETGKSKVVDGKWEITFEPRDGAPRVYTIEIYGSEKSNRIIFENVKVGDVWLVLGQSNVEYRFDNMGNYKEIYAKITGEENLSVFYINSVDYKKLASFGNNLIEGSKMWYDTNHPMINNASALGICTGLDLIRIGDNYTPIGVISMGFSGQELACFVPEEQSKKLSGYGDKSLIYNNFIRHINKYAIKGVIWYQGEANGAYVAEYADGLADFIEFFREERNQINKNFPFYIIELPPCFDSYRGYEKLDWQYIDYGRVRAVTGSVPMKTENCYIVSTSDTWSNRTYINNLHPDNKSAIAERLALMICSNEWNFPGYATVFAPTVKSVNKIDEKGKVYELVYDYAVDGLKWNGEAGVGFEAITEDWHFVDIEVEIVGKDTVRITGNKPIYRITYGKDTSALSGEDVTLCNSGGIPAAAFEYDIYNRGEKPHTKIIEIGLFVVLIVVNVCAATVAIIRKKKKK